MLKLTNRKRATGYPKYKKNKRTVENNSLCKIFNKMKFFSLSQKD